VAVCLRTEGIDSHCRGKDRRAREKGGDLRAEPPRR
jgi:hypothetical protein